MASIKIKFRESLVDNKEGSLYYQVIQSRIVRQISTNYKVYASEWDSHSEKIVLPLFDSPRRNLLMSYQERIEWDMRRLRKVIGTYSIRGIKFSADEIVAEYHRLSEECSLSNFMHHVITQLQQLGRARTAETYTATLVSFTAFRNGADIPLDGIDSDLMAQYEGWLANRGVAKNTVSFYMRILRAVYNRAVEKGLTEQRFPFKHVYTGIDKTVKRAISIDTIKKLKVVDLSLKPALDFARDMFLFSFYTRGMSFVDMAYLKKKDLQNEMLVYRRRKTKQQLLVKWEPCMQEIVDKYFDNGSEYLLPIIKQSTLGRNGKKQDERTLYKNAFHLVNHHLKELSKMMGISPSLTMYVARHSWASAAKMKNVPLSVISEGMGHDSEATTQIYLASLDSSIIDRANKMILDNL